MTEAEIRESYKTQHDNLSTDYYTGTSGLAKEQFDAQHGQIWNDMQAELIAGGFITIPEPSRDLAKEIDKIKAELEILKTK